MAAAGIAGTDATTAATATTNVATTVPVVTVTTLSAFVQAVVAGSSNVAAPPQPGNATAAPPTQLPAATATVTQPATVITPPAYSAPGAPGYTLELLLNARRETVATQTAVALDAATLKQLVTGAVMKLLAQSPVPVAAGSVLQLQITPGQAPKILNISMPTALPATLRTFIADAMVRQGSPGPLLQSLVSLLPASASALPSATPALPAPIHALIAQLVALLPDVENIKNEGVLEKFIRKSGIFWEASLAKPDKVGIVQATQARMQGQPDNSVQQTTDSQNNAAESGVASKHKSVGALFEQLRGRLQAALQTEKPVSISVADATAENTKVAIPASRTTTAGGATTEAGEFDVDVDSDFKPLLLKLEKLLVQAMSDQPKMPVEKPLSTEVASVSAAPLDKQDATPEDATTKDAAKDTTTKDTKAVTSPVNDQDLEITGKRSVFGENKSASPSSVEAPARKVSDQSATSNALSQTGAEAEEQAKGVSTTQSRSDTTHKTRGAALYQQLEQATRPPGVKSFTAAKHGATPENPLAPPPERWQESLSSIEIPGVGLPLPLSTRGRPSRNEEKDTLDTLLNVLLKRTQESLGRLNLHQLAHAGTTTRDANSAQPNPPLTFDLPILFNGQVQIFNTRIEEEELPYAEENTPNKKEKQWSVSLGFDIESLGPMFCQLRMTNMHANLQFWAESPSTLALTKSNVGFLSKSLHDLGVSVSEVSCHDGLPKQVRTQLSQQLVDITT